MHTEMQHLVPYPCVWGRGRVCLKCNNYSHYINYLAIMAMSFVASISVSLYLKMQHIDSIKRTRGKAMRRKEIPGESQPVEQEIVTIADEKSPPDEIVKIDVIEIQPDLRGWVLTDKGWVHHG